MAAKYHYYLHDCTPCRVTIEGDNDRMSAEGYFTGQGFTPVAVLSVLQQGESITEREFKTIISQKILKQ